MPFLVYAVTTERDGLRHRMVDGGISLAGSSGPIARLVMRSNDGRPPPFEWHLDASDILRELGFDPVGHSITIDLKPRVQNNVSLFRLTDIWGYSYAEWTPVALRLDVLFADRGESDPAAFKQEFVLGRRSLDVVGEFLYLQGGVLEGTWNWGLVGRVNGALLWPEALHSLTRRLLDGTQPGLARP
ncbi:MAG: hypothetical protein FJX72_16290 [Armatimonadetes bacterium]|nr:hypothetical protein [Armatimonadota bacterium]